MRRMPLTGGWRMPFLSSATIAARPDAADVWLDTVHRLAEVRRAQRARRDAEIAGAARRHP